MERQVRKGVSTELVKAPSPGPVGGEGGVAPRGNEGFSKYCEQAGRCEF